MPSVSDHSLLAEEKQVLYRRTGSLRDRSSLPENCGEKGPEFSTGELREDRPKFSTGELEEPGTERNRSLEQKHGTEAWNRREPEHGTEA